jgi:hypothetical protein
VRKGAPSHFPAKGGNVPEMPASYNISPLLACIIIRLEGTVSDDDLLEGQQRMFSDPLFSGHYLRLVDGTEITEFAVSAETVKAVASAAVERGLRMAALISNDTDLVSALMRMYEAYASPPAEVAVYQNMQDGLRWLARSIES